MVLWTMLALAPVVFVLLLVVSAPYGRYSRAGWGPRMNSRPGWLLMESPACLIVGWVMLCRMELSLLSIVFLLIWEFHYVYRSFVYPFVLRSGRKMPVSVVLMGMSFNAVNAYLISFHFVFNPASYPQDWLWSPAFLAGTGLYGLGYWITRSSDRVLRELRAPGETGYRIPRGGLFRFVSCPNYLGEMIQWAGFALLTWSPAGLVFLLWTVANLLPRAISHHRWYRETFQEYPDQRKAVFPGLI